MNYQWPFQMLRKTGLSKVFDKEKKDIKKDLQGLRDRLNKSKKEEAGAGEEGTDELVNKYKKDTPNA